MPTPAVVTVNGALSPLLAASKVRFTVPVALRYNAGPDVVLPHTIEAEVDVDGTFAVGVYGSNDPAWSPSNWTYKVTVVGDNMLLSWDVQVPYNATPINFSSLLPASAASNGVLYAAFNHVHEIEDITDLQTQLDAKLDVPVQPYLDADDISNLVSTETLSESLTPLTADIALAKAGLVKATDVPPLKGWTFDLAHQQGALVVPTSGLAHVARVQALDTVVSNIHFHVTTPGSGLTGGYAALYNDAGALLGAGAVTADLAASWASGGYKTHPLNVAQGVTKYGWYRVLFWFTGTTGPALSRAGNSSGPAINGPLAAPNFRFATANTGLTNTPPANIGAMTSGGTAWWVGLS